ncbi:MAG: ACP S-malonyltransferase [Desulfobacterales bacterium]
MKKTAFLFPGQGSQIVGMGLDFYQEYDVVRELFDMAEEISKIKISDLCFKGPMEDLTQTVNLQPAVTAVNLACLSAVEKEGVRPDMCAGHSLGEYSAMRASDSVSPEDTFRMVFKRGIDEVAEIVDQVKKEGIVAIANHNAQKQIVITGSPGPVEKASSLAAAKGAKAIPLKVSGAWHSDLIKGAFDEFKDFIESIHFNTPQRPLIFNVTADVEKDPDEIKSIMTRQLCSPVKWYDSMSKLMGKHIEIFAEVGPGKVLTGLLKKILPKDYPCRIFNISSMKALEQFLKETT